MIPNQPPDEALLRETASLMRAVLSFVEGRRSSVALSSLLGALTLAARATGCPRQEFLSAVQEAYDNAPPPDAGFEDVH